jgi:hypothetical protein
VYEGVLTLTVKEPIPTSTSMDTTAMACNYELDVWCLPRILHLSSNRYYKVLGVWSKGLLTKHMECF